jgi:hypothetical protein
MKGIVTTFIRLPLSMRNFILSVYLIFKNNGRTGNDWCLDSKHKSCMARQGF